MLPEHVDYVVTQCPHGEWAELVVSKTEVVVHTKGKTYRQVPPRISIWTINRHDQRRHDECTLLGWLCQKKTLCAPDDTQRQLDGTFTLDACLTQWVFVAIDVVEWNGTDLTHRSYDERRLALAELVRGFDPLKERPVRYLDEQSDLRIMSPHVLRATHRSLLSHTVFPSVRGIPLRGVAYHSTSTLGVEWKIYEGRT